MFSLLNCSINLERKFIIISCTDRHCIVLHLENTCISLQIPNKIAVMRKY